MGIVLCLHNFFAFPPGTIFDFSEGIWLRSKFVNPVHSPGLFSRVQQFPPGFSMIDIYHQILWRPNCCATKICLVVLCVRKSSIIFILHIFWTGVGWDDTTGPRHQQTKIGTPYAVAVVVLSRSPKFQVEDWPSARKCVSTKGPKQFRQKAH